MPVKDKRPRSRNPLRLDPTRTTLLRRAFMADMSRRFRSLRVAIVRLVDGEDAFGLRGPAKPPVPLAGVGGTSSAAAGATVLRTHARGLVANIVRLVGGLWYVYSEAGKRLSHGYKTKKGAADRLKEIERFKYTGNAGPVTNTRWQFATDDLKLAEYRAWLKAQVQAGVLAVDPKNAAQPWVQPYITSAYRKGLIRAYVDTRKVVDKSLGFVQGGQRAFLSAAFDSPVGQSKLKLLGTRAFAQLEGVTAQMDQEMSRILAQGLAQGTGPRALARELAKNVTTLERKRALAIARTEVVHAHAEGQLDSFEAMNVEEVDVMAEWSTAGDAVVCEMCIALEGVVMTVREARGTLPRHPNCRCAWVPANVGEQKGGTTRYRRAGPSQGLEAPGTAPTGKTTGQVRSKSAIDKRISKSIRAEHPKLKAKQARAASKWAGADKKITGKRKPVGV